MKTEGVKKGIFENLLAEKENGLRALLALTGFANESLKRLITVVRVAENKEVAKLLLKDTCYLIPPTTNTFHTFRYLAAYFLKKTIDGSTKK